MNQLSSNVDKDKMDRSKIGMRKAPDPGALIFSDTHRLYNLLTNYLFSLTISVL